MIQLLKNNRGASLLEVVASLVIITIILLSFSQFFLQAKKTAAYNNEKLVTINLADAALVKLQNQQIAKTTDPDLNKYFEKATIEKTITMNDKTYRIDYKPEQSDTKYQNRSEIELGLIKVEVTVYSPDNKTKGVTQGYVKLIQ